MSTSGQLCGLQVTLEDLKGDLGECAAEVDMGVLSEGLSLLQGTWPLPRYFSEALSFHQPGMLSSVMACKFMKVPCAASVGCAGQPC